ncbi:hypothetical protein D1Y84_03470 [Acidipila sp. EB88]|nr:hypothetical protein D1Y84_03470 [Acidipila sp. EB88]
MRHVCRSSAGAASRQFHPVPRAPRRRYDHRRAAQAL